MPTVRQSEQYASWFGDLRDRQAKARIVVGIRAPGSGDPGAPRVLSGSVAELKIDVGPGYRVYYTPPRRRDYFAAGAGITREGLYKAIGESGNPSFATVFRLIRALGLAVKLEAAPA